MTGSGGERTGSSCRLENRQRTFASARFVGPDKSPGCKLSSTVCTTSILLVWRQRVMAIQRDRHIHGARCGQWWYIDRDRRFDRNAVQHMLAGFQRRDVPTSPTAMLRSARRRSRRPRVKHSMSSTGCSTTRVTSRFAGITPMAEVIPIMSLRSAPCWGSSSPPGSRT
jgi:hypothetical protein